MPTNRAVITGALATVAALTGALALSAPASGATAREQDPRLPEQDPGRGCGVPARPALTGSTTKASNWPLGSLGGGPSGQLRE